MVIGAGFAGLEVARELGRAGVDVCVVDRHNHHIFQPLLYQVATAALSAPDIAEPVRKILRDFPSVTSFSARWSASTGRPAGRSSPTARRSPTTISSSPPALRTGYFGHDDWAALAPGLKTIEDAREIRSPPAPDLRAGRARPTTLRSGRA